jgi:hypothetical protein
MSKAIELTSSTQGAASSLSHCLVAERARKASRFPSPSYENGYGNGEFTVTGPVFQYNTATERQYSISPSRNGGLPVRRLGALLVGLRYLKRHARFTGGHVLYVINSTFVRYCLTDEVDYVTRRFNASSAGLKIRGAAPSLRHRLARSPDSNWSLRVSRNFVHQFPEKDGEMKKRTSWFRAELDCS